MAGGLGNDTYRVDSALDKAVEVAGQGTDTVIASVSYALQGGSEVELLRTAGPGTTTAINLTGNAFAQTLQGNAAANTLDGKGGADTMQGVLGNDTYFVDNAGDVIVEAAGQGTDTVIATTSYTLAAGASVEVLRTLGSATTYAVNLTGNELGNAIYGNAAANTILGKAGNDTLFGGGGNDSFVFDTALGAGNLDTILDFNAPQDTIQLENAIFTGLAAGTLAAGAFRIGATAADADDRIVYNSATGALIFDSNGSAAGGAVQFAKLGAGLALTNADFLVV
jgi:Ca2+-binding RTX toxin-like protein